VVQLIVLPEAGKVVLKPLSQLEALQPLHQYLVHIVLLDMMEVGEAVISMIMAAAAVLLDIVVTEDLDHLHMGGLMATAVAAVAVEVIVTLHIPVVAAVVVFTHLAKDQVVKGNLDQIQLRHLLVVEAAAPGV
jgi:hypothetical protein